MPDLHKSSAEAPEGDQGNLCLSALQRKVLTAPDVTLYAGQSPENEQAFQTLEEAGITFQVIRCNRPMAPSVDWGGVRFERIDGIERLADLLKRFNAAALETGAMALPDLFQNPDPHLRSWMRETRSTQLQEARATLDGLPQAEDAQ